MKNFLGTFLISLVVIFLTVLVTLIPVMLFRATCLLLEWFFSMILGMFGIQVLETEIVCVTVFVAVLTRTIFCLLNKD